MPQLQYRVEAPDGKVYNIESDRELSEEEIFASLPKEGPTVLGIAKGLVKQPLEDVKGIIDYLKAGPQQFRSQQEAKDFLNNLFSWGTVKEQVVPSGPPEEKWGRTAARIGELALPFAGKVRGAAKPTALPKASVTTTKPSLLTDVPLPATSQYGPTTGPSFGFRMKAPADIPLPKEPSPVIAARGGIEPPVKGGATPTVGEMRRMYGSEEAGNRIGMTKAEVKQAAPGPSRKPLNVELAEMDAGYKRSLANPRGAISPKAMFTLGSAAGGAALMQPQNKENPLAAGLFGALGGAAAMNPMITGRFLKDLRTTSLLSGYAPAKSLMGNVGAAGNAAILTGSTKPITEMLRLPTNIRNFGQAWKAGANPSETPGFRRMNIPGRVMGAADATAQQALERGGVSTAQAQNLLLTEPNAAAQMLGLKNTVGEYLMPFQKTNFNQFKGIQNIAGANPNFSKARQMGLAAGYGGAGYIAGQESQNPVALSMMAALTGPFAPAFLLGAVPSAGPRIAESLTPISGWTLGRDLSDPLHWLTNPGFMRFVQPQQ